MTVFMGDFMDKICNSTLFQLWSTFHGFTCDYIHTHVYISLCMYMKTYKNEDYLVTLTT